MNPPIHSIVPWKVGSVRHYLSTARPKAGPSIHPSLLSQLQIVSAISLGLFSEQVSKVRRPERLRFGQFYNKCCLQ
ncbi:hypothetical protein TNCT_487031 [Trichonephila clavata]|uniref:Uncharacterized protein n=1 Tax=Trichonephila clavata TaxID=2740835 RepID=A0A8X6G7U4_TRICU|nr:hypothetical protein TNCT_487031 [Trichonephila clavata]